MSTLEPLRFIWCYPVDGDAYTGTTDNSGLRLFFDNEDGESVEYHYAPDHDAYVTFSDDGARGYHFSPDETYAVTIYPMGKPHAQPGYEVGTFQEK